MWAILPLAVPVICVGNITVGGTGKTPHVEYLIRLYQNTHKVAVLSRGYGRKTKGFRLVEVSDNAENVGDEPLQMKQKFPQITFAVDEKRTRGIAELQKIGHALVILDDAFQHRAVKPSKSIVLLDYNRLPSNDFYLPTGNLRDGRYSLQRADVVLITKCPKQLPELEKQQIVTKNKLTKPCFFTHFDYGAIEAFASNEKVEDFTNLNVLAVTGIANPKPLLNYLQTKGAKVKSLPYADHYDFSGKDLQKISQEFARLQADKKIILTTEKDKVKLLPLLKSQPDLISNFYYLPIKVAFEDANDSEAFEKMLS